MFCDQCGKPIIPNALYCRQCGSAVVVLESESAAPAIPETDADTSSLNMSAAETQEHAPTLPTIGPILHAWRKLAYMKIQYRHAVAVPMTWAWGNLDVGISDQYIFFCSAPGNTKAKEYLDKFGDKWKYVALLGAGGGLIGAGIATAIALIPWLAGEAFEESKGKNNTLSQDELASYYRLGLLAYAEKSLIKVELVDLHKGWFAPQQHMAFISGHFTTINGEMDICCQLSDKDWRQCGGQLAASLAVKKGLMAARVETQTRGGSGIAILHVLQENLEKYRHVFGKNGELVIEEDLPDEWLKEK